jgi:hypothetical protein
MSADEMIAHGRAVRQVFSEFENEVESGMSMRQVVTLASIIEKETGALREGPHLRGLSQQAEKGHQATERPDGHLRDIGV